MERLTRWEVPPQEDKPFVLSTTETISLHFDSLHVQSAMAVEDPFRLYLHYTQAMMGFKLFKQDPANILIVGLGGGSLSKYCYRRFPEARVVTVEISREVLALRDRFRIPEDCDRFRVVHADALDYMQNIDTPADIVLLDGFTSEGLPESLCSVEFYRYCYHALTRGGIVVANFLAEDPRLHEHIGRLAGIFNGNCVIGTANSCKNYILLARNSTEQLHEDDVTDVHRLIVRQRKSLNIPYFERFANFSARHMPDATPHCE